MTLGDEAVVGGVVGAAVGVAVVRVKEPSLVMPVSPMTPMVSCGGEQEVQL